MTSPNCIKIGFAFLILTSVQAPSRGQNPAPKLNQSPQDVPLRWFLQDIGKKWGCYFTVENALTFVDDRGRVVRTEWNREPMIGEAIVPAVIKDQSPPEAMKTLQSLVPNFAYEVDQRDPRIFHIRDARLRKVRDYSLDRAVTAFEFKGTRAELVEALAAQGFPLRNSPHSFRSPEPDDLITVVRVGEDSVSVREVLSSFIPSDPESRFLWESETLLHSTGSAYIFYP